MVSFIKKTEFDLTPAEPFGVSAFIFQKSFQLPKILPNPRTFSNLKVAFHLSEEMILSSASRVFSALRFELTVVIGNVKFLK